MNDSITITKVLFAFLILGVVWAIISTFYMSWFRPSQYLERARKGVQGWWPFAEYFRSYYGSSGWLWPNRIASAIFLFVILYLVYEAIHGRFHIQLQP